MELRQHLAVLRKWSWLIALAAVIAVGFGYGVDSRTPRVYRTTTTLIVGQFLKNPDPTAQDFQTSQQLAQSYAQLARRRPVLQATVDTLGLHMGWERLAEQVSATAVTGTQFLQLSVADTDPRRAKSIADELARQVILQSPTPQEQEQEQRRQFVEQQLRQLQANIDTASNQIDELERRLASETGGAQQDTQNQVAALEQKITTWQSTYARLLDSSTGSSINYLSVLEPAVVPTTPVGPRTPLNLLLAAAIGCLLAVGAAFLLEYVDDTVKTGEDTEAVLGLPALGTIARIRRIQEPPDHLVALQQPSTPISEAYRILRTNVQFASLSDPVTRLLVTSAAPGEGKTTTACNLGITMAQAGRRVILCDTNLRRPTLHRFFGLPNRVGLTSLLLDDTLRVGAALAETSVSGLRILPSGPLPPNPTELLGSESMQRRLNDLEAFADVIIFDSPPALAVADAAVLGRLCTGVVLVVAAGRTRTDVVRRGQAALDRPGLKILGVVLNQVGARRAARSYPSYAAPGGAGSSRRRGGSSAWSGPST